MIGKTLKTLSFLFFWIAIPVAVLVAAFEYKAGMLAVCLYAFLILLAVSRLMTLFWLRPLRCEREVSSAVVNVGESVKVIVKLTNTAPWPILWLYAEETLPPKAAKNGVTRRLCFIPPRRSFFLTYSVTMPQRGCHQIGPLVLESGDVFGLFRKCRVEPRRDYITVLPKYQLIDSFELGRHQRLGDLPAGRSIFEDPTCIRGVREYRRGDAMKRIHWKSSARTGQLRSKIFDPVVEAAATVVLDFHKDTWAEARSRDEFRPAAEMAVEVACTICRYLSDGGWRFGFFSNGRDPLGLPGLTIAQAQASDSLRDALHSARQRRRDERLAPIAIRASQSPEQFSIIHENLGRIELTDGLPLERLLADELPYIAREQALIILTGRVTDSFIDSMIRTRAQGYRIMLYVICNNEAHDRAFEELVPHGVELYRMDEEWRLKELATGRRHI